MPITHAAVVAVADDGTSLVGTDEWNDGHIGLATDADFIALEARVTLLEGRVTLLEALPAEALYGSAIVMTGLGNAPTNSVHKWTHRFRAESSSTLASIRFYLQGTGSGAGYGGGTGGTATFTIQTDDGSADHLPSGTILATEAVTNLTMADTPGYQLIWTSPPTLVSGALYHFVFENTTADPDTNYFSLNCVYQDQPVTPEQPKYADSDWRLYYWTGSAWTHYSGYSLILELAYASGARHGVAYVLLNYGADKGTIGGGDANDRVRELFTVSGHARPVTGAAVRVMQDGGTDALTVGLYTGADALVDSFTIAAASIPDGAIGSNALGQAARYVSGSFAAAQTLDVGSTYYLRLSTGAGSTYYTFPVRRGDVSYGYSPLTVFSDGVCQKTTDGTTWVSLGYASNENNLPFYFVMG